MIKIDNRLDESEDVSELNYPLPTWHVYRKGGTPAVAGFYYF
jgi:hypothetical protein